MKKKIILSILILLLFTAIITNPNKNDYVAWCKESSMNKSEDILSYGLLSVFGNSIYTTTTKSSNYYLFSIYETNIVDNEIKVLGIFNKFIPISKTGEIKNKI